MIPATRRTLAIGATLLAAAAVYGLLQVWIPERAARGAAILVVGAGFWATEALPLFATAFVVIGLEIVLLADVGGLAAPSTRVLAELGAGGVTAPVAEPIDAARFLAPFAQDIVILFLSGFLISAAMSKHGVDRVLAARLLRPLATSPRRLAFGLLGLSAFFSMWMSNTATAAMMLSLLGPLLAGRPVHDRLGQSLVLAVAFGANIGGLGTPIGTPPNAIAFGALNAAGYRITFLAWMLVAIPLTLLLLGLAGVVLDRFLRPAAGTAPLAIPDPGVPLSRAGMTTLLVLAAAVVLWITSGLHGVRPGAVGLLAVAVLSAIGSLGRDDVNAIDWSVLILLWGGLSLSVGMDASGLTAVLAGLDVAALTGGPWLAALATLIAAVLLSTVMSNTAAAALLVPMALALALPASAQVAMLAALGCSLAMALPVSTPPNAVAYATGRVELATMRRLGGAVSIAGSAIVLAGYPIVLPLIF